MGNGVGVAFGARPGAEESSMMKPRLQTKSKAGVSQNGESIECRAERNDPVEAYRRMELKGASLSSAARGEVSWERGIEGEIRRGNGRNEGGVRGRSSRVGRRGRCGHGGDGAAQSRGAAWS